MSDEAEVRFWSIVDRDGLTGLPSDMWAALETLVMRAARVPLLIDTIHDAINRPKGVDPASAEPFYDAKRMTHPTPTPTKDAI